MKVLKVLVAIYCYWKRWFIFGRLAFWLDIFYCKVRALGYALLVPAHHTGTSH